MYLLLIKYGANVLVNDINTIVNIKNSFTIAEMSHIQYLHTHICTILGKYNVNPNYYAVRVPLPLPKRSLRRKMLAKELSRLPVQHLGLVDLFMPAL